MKAACRESDNGVSGGVLPRASPVGPGGAIAAGDEAPPVATGAHRGEGVGATWSADADAAQTRRNRAGFKATVQVYTGAVRIL